MICFCGCGTPAAHSHHVYYAQHLRQQAGRDKALARQWVRDPRGQVPAGHHCHFTHHSAARKYRISDLPDQVFEFGVEVFGGPKAAALLRRYYQGEDPRLETILGND